MRKSNNDLSDAFMRSSVEPVSLSDKVAQRLKANVNNAIQSTRRMRSYEAFYNAKQEQDAPRDFFKADYLTGDSMATEFLEQVVQEAPIGNLKQVIWSCCYDQNLTFAAVLVEIKDEKLKALYGGNYLMEVWHQGILLYQRPLKRKVRAWNSSRHKNSIIYLLDYEDEVSDGDIIHVLSLQQACQACSVQAFENLSGLLDTIEEVKVCDWTGLCADPANLPTLNFALDKNNILYVSTSTELAAASLDDLQRATQINDYSAELNLFKFGAQTRFGRIEFGTNLRLLFLHDSEQSFARANGSTVLAIFDNDTVADFNHVNATPDADYPDKLNLVLHQITEPATRAASPGDYIIDLKNLNLKDGKQATVARRLFGAVDLYWNCRLIASTEGQEGDFTYTRVKMNFESILLQRFSSETKSHQVMLSLEQQQRTTFEDLMVVPEKQDADLAFFINQKYKGLLKPYQEFFIYKKFLLVAYGNILSYYNIEERQWRCHYKFQEGPEDSFDVNKSFAYAIKKKVIKVFRNDTRSGDFGIGVLFQDGSLKQISFARDAQNQDVMREAKISAEIQGKIVGIACDREHHRILYVVSEVNGEGKLWGFTKGSLYDLSQIAKVTPKSLIIPYFSPAVNSQIVIVEPDQNFLRIYEHNMLVDASGQESISLKRVKKIQGDGFNARIDVSSLHTVVSTKGEELLIFFDKNDMHVFNMRTARLDPEIGGYRVTDVVTHKNVNVRSLQLYEDRHMYVMFDEVQVVSSFSRSKALTPQQVRALTNIGSKSGIGYMDLQVLLSDVNKKPELVPILDAMVGVNHNIMLSGDDRKLIILANFSKIKILPILHHNSLSFDGIKPKSAYIFGRQSNDRFIAVERLKNFKRVWCMQSGKLESSESFRISNLVPEVSIEADNSQYEIYKSVQEQQRSDNCSLYEQGVLPYNLVYLTDPVADMTDEVFFGERIKGSPIQICALKTIQKTFHHFLVIALDEMGEVVVRKKFVYPRYHDREQHLFVSQDFSRLLEITSDQASICLLEDKGVRFEGYVSRLPVGIYDGNIEQLFCLFSPDFTKHIDTEPTIGQWVIRESLSGDVHFKIPATFLCLDSRNRIKVMQQTKFMAWESNNLVSLIDIDADPHIHEVIEIPEKTEATKLSYEVAAGTIPFFDKEPYLGLYEANEGERPCGSSNFFKTKLSFAIGDTTARLKRMHKRLKMAWYLQHPSQRIETLVEQKKNERFESCYKKLFTVDYSSDPDSWFIEIPFTFIDWRQIELLQMLCSDNSLSANTRLLDIALTPEKAQTLTLNILPNINTILHLIASNYDFIRYFLDFAKPLEVPFIANIDGQSPLHLALEQNTRVAEYFLQELLPPMPLDHHGRVIASAIPTCVQKQIDFLGEYLDSRFLSTRQLKKVSRTQNMTIKFEKGTSDERQFVSVCDLWPDEDLLKQRVFEESPNGEEVVIQVFDMPKLHQPNDPSAQEFANALAELEDTNIFAFKSVRAIISFRWETTRQYVLRKQMLPYVGFFSAYLIYALYILDIDNEIQSTSALIQTFWQVLLIAFSLYFFYGEWLQFKSQRWKYVTNFWNYADVVPPIGIILTILLSWIFHEGAALQTFRFSVQALVCFGMWIKIFYFLRIFRNTGYFVNMLLRVVSSSRVFFLLYVLILCAFGCTFFIMSPAGPDYTITSYFSYTFMLSIGDYDTDFSAYPVPVMMRIAFLGAIFTVQIVMLNLLIAIVSSAYEEVISSQQQANDFERVNLIADVSAFIPKKIGLELCRPNEQLIVASIPNYSVDPAGQTKSA